MESYQEFIDGIINTRGRFSCDGYYERHHIIPRCCGGTNDDDNLVDLYAREHFIAHRLLALENPDNKKLAYAWWKMSFGKNQDRITHIVTAEEYEEAKIAISKIQSLEMSGINNPMYGRTHTEETREKLRSLAIGRTASDETRERMRKKHLGIHASKETCRKITESRLGSKNPLAKSIYCLELNQTFGTITEAATYLRISRNTLNSCLNGDRETAGKCPSTNEPLHWLYLEDAIKLGYVIQQND